MIHQQQIGTCLIYFAADSKNGGTVRVVLLVHAIIFSGDVEC